MDRTSLPPGSIEAGRAYDAALRALGLKPDGLLWAWDKTIEHYVLVLLTEHFDFAGPLRIYETLTRAYNTSVTPSEISPFIVRVHSPRQAFIQNLPIADVGPVGGGRSEDMVLTTDTSTLTFTNHWVYYWPESLGNRGLVRRREPTARNREWARFERNVMKRAA